ncbi:hypothetical protein LX32DRAFT_642630 [Colletotrichum zoysiae]|uniref:Uncharacterized protein n=1 Tax=Colletotrichum zoysiae TaxID=1216348 RepID=A0AAD9HCQ9_9PEZI|nr:hypothetical protein LX32DRAFT_642630 [Colletotrichum zoysiae]
MDPRHQSAGHTTYGGVGFFGCLLPGDKVPCALTGGNLQHRARYIETTDDLAVDGKEG